MKNKEIIVSEEFQLIDKNKHIRAIFEMFDKDPSLRFSDRNKCTRICIEMASNNPGITLFHPKAKASVVVGSVFPTNPGVIICTDNGNLGITMLINSNNNMIEIYDTQHESCWKSN